MSHESLAVVMAAASPELSEKATSFEAISAMIVNIQSAVALNRILGRGNEEMRANLQILQNSFVILRTNAVHLDDMIHNFSSSLSGLNEELVKIRDKKDKKVGIRVLKKRVAKYADSDCSSDSSEDSMVVRIKAVFADREARNIEIPDKSDCDESELEEIVAEVKQMSCKKCESCGKKYAYIKEVKVGQVSDERNKAGPSSQKKDNYINSLARSLFKAEDDDANDDDDEEYFFPRRC